MSENPLRVGVLVSGRTIPAWQADALERMLARTDTEITYLVANAESGGGGGLREYVETARDHPLWAPVGAVHAFGETPPHLRPRNVMDVAGIGNPVKIECYPEDAPDFGTVLPESVVAELDGEVDVLVRYGFGILKGDVLDTPEHGVLSFHHGDLREYRGQPAGFWEFVNGDDVAGVTLQRLNETLDGGTIVAFEPVDIADADTWREVRALLFDASTEMLAAGVENILDPDTDPERPGDLGDLYTLPTGRDVVRYVVRNNVGKLRRTLS